MVSLVLCFTLTFGPCLTLSFKMRKTVGMTEFVLHLPEQHLPGILGSVWRLRPTLGLMTPFTLRRHCGPVWKVNQRILLGRKHWLCLKHEACSRQLQKLCGRASALPRWSWCIPFAPYACHVTNKPCHHPDVFPEEHSWGQMGSVGKLKFRLKLYKDRSSVFQLLLAAQSEVLQWPSLLSCPYVS